MAIEHDSIVDAERHEPKGISTANSGDVYKANGAGSGSWKSIGGATHGEMAVINKSASFTPTGTNITDDANYIKIGGAGLWDEVHVSNMTFNVDELQVSKTGDYYISFWLAFETTAAAGTLYGIRYAVDDSTPYSTRTLSASKNSTGTDRITIAASGIVAGLTAGQTLSVYGASTSTTAVTLKDAGFSVILLDET